MKDSLNLWGFEVRTKDGESIVTMHGPLTKDGEEVLFLGSAVDASSMAARYQAGLAGQFPQKEVAVRPVAREQLGPRAVRQIARVGMEREEWKAMARFLAWRMAESVARTSLELNPNIPAIATQILEEARIGTMEELEKAKAKRGGVVVGLDGKPARA